MSMMMPYSIRKPQRSVVDVSSIMYLLCLSIAVLKLTFCARMIFLPNVNNQAVFPRYEYVFAIHVWHGAMARWRDGRGGTRRALSARNPVLLGTLFM